MYIKYPEYLNLAPFMYMPAATSPRRLRLDVPFPYSGASTPEGSITPTNTNDLKAELGQLLTNSLLSSFSFSRQNSETRYGWNVDMDIKYEDTNYLFWTFFSWGKKLVCPDHTWINFQTEKNGDLIPLDTCCSTEKRIQTYIKKPLIRINPDYLINMTASKMSVIMWFCFF